MEDFAHFILAIAKISVKLVILGAVGLYIFESTQMHCWSMWGCVDHSPQTQISQLEWGCYVDHRAYNCNEIDRLQKEIDTHDTK